MSHLVKLVTRLILEKWVENEGVYVMELKYFLNLRYI